MLDARLVIPAAAAWLAAIIVQFAANSLVDAQARRTVIGWLGACVLAGLLGLIMGVYRWPPGRATAQAVVRSAAFGLAVGLASSGLAVIALAEEPVASWTQARSTITALGVISGEPIIRQRTSAAIWQSSSMTEVRFDTSSVASRGVPVLVDLPMMLRGSGTGPMPPVGSVVEVSGRLGPSKRPGLAATVSVTDIEDIRVLASPGLIDQVANAMRAGLRTAVGGVPEQAGALVAGLAVGDESLQTPQLASAMQNAGLSHLTAVSGGNVAVILVAVIALTRLVGLRLVGRVIASLACLAFFVVLVHPQPSVLRAAVMGAVVLVGLLGGGRGASTGVLATSILVLIAAAPALALSWGFALSVAATAGLIVLAPLLQHWLARWRVSAGWPPGWREAVAVTSAAQLATLPLLIGMGSAVGLAAVPANLLAMPAVPAVTILGLIAALVSPVLPGLAAVLAHLAAIPAGWIAWVARTCSGLPLATIPWPSGWLGVVSLAVAALAGWWTVRGIRRRYPNRVPPQIMLTTGVCMSVLLAAVIIAPPSRRGWPPAGWLLVACDVGQGDGLVVRVDANSALVVDVGPDGDAMVACLRDLGIDQLSAIVLTHFHADHVNGLSQVLDAMPVGMVYANPVPEPSDQADMVQRALTQAQVPSETLHAGDVRAVGQVRWQVLWPRRVITSGSVPNNASAVLLMQAYGVRILLPGDIEPPAQVAVMATAPGLSADVVKVPHHGSKYQDARFASWTHGRIALVSVGLVNDYGHPAQQTLDQWAGLGALVGRTDLEGDLAVVADGGHLGLVTRGT